MPSHTSRDDPNERAANLQRAVGYDLPVGANLAHGVGGSMVTNPLKPEQIPTNLHRDEYDPFGYADDPHEEARSKAIKALPKGGTPQEGNARMLALLEQYPYPDEKPSAEQELQMEYTHPIDPNKGRWSDDPKFKHVQLVQGPRLHPDGRVSVGPKLQWNMDPEKHIERTSNAPGAEGSAPGERAWDQLQGDPVPAYGGSVDARTDTWGAHQATSKVWEGKKTEVLHSAGAEEPIRDKHGKHLRSAKTGMPAYKKVHGAGLFDALMSGEDIRSPIHMIRDPEEPIYGPRRVRTYQNEAGEITNIDPSDQGGFGHDEPVQWQGHHRAAAAALKQQGQREAAEDAGTAAEGGWSVPVPFKMHEGRDAAISSMTWGAGFPGTPGVSEHLTEMLHQSRVAAFAKANPGGSPPGASSPTPKRVLGGRMAPGTWNSKAY